MPPKDGPGGGLLRDDAAVCRGWTRATIWAPLSISTRRNSRVCWRFSHSRGVVPKYRASRSAVSAVTPR